MRSGDDVICDKHSSDKPAVMQDDCALFENIMTFLTYWCML